jgi:hypothetical protein
VTTPPVSALPTAAKDGSGCPGAIASPASATGATAAGRAIWAELLKSISNQNAARIARTIAQALRSVRPFIRRASGRLVFPTR